MCGVIAICQVCQKHVKGSIKVSSNFILHMRSKHPKKYAEFKAKKNENRQKTGRKSALSEDVLNFLCDTCSPLSLIESKSFLKLFPGKKMPSRRSITRLLSDSNQKYVHKLSIALENVNCTQIWHKCHRPKSAEIISAVLSSQLITPCVTRWNSLYDSVKKLLEHKHKLGELCYRLGVPSFLGSEIEYLEEYLKVLKPIAEGIDFLQGEQNMFFGYFIPTLVSIKMKLRRLENENLAFLERVNIEMQKALHKRFEKYFYLKEDSLDAVIAAIVIPDVKLRFLKTLLETANNITEDDIKTHLNHYGLEFAKQLEKTPNATSISSQAS
uniref:Uncharacterized protein n=1 Tax=Musca domestica TaxID=7370 RepID=A0A1I8NJF1_MUSDO